jgi:hypothetical protein
MEIGNIMTPGTLTPAATNTPAFECDWLTKTYGGKVALRDLGNL